MFSKDEGKTWDIDNILYESKGEVRDIKDIGYPSSVELPDGKILTTFYAHENIKAPAEIMQVIWSYKED